MQPINDLLPKMPLRSAYEEIYLMHARDLVRTTREEKDLSYKELCRRLQAFDIFISPQVLTNKMNRSTYSFGFALLLLDVMGVTSIKVPHLQGTRPQRRTGSG